jgi:hypothetical protein
MRASRNEEAAASDGTRHEDATMIDTSSSSFLCITLLLFRAATRSAPVPEKP